MTSARLSEKTIESTAKRLRETESRQKRVSDPNATRVPMTDYAVATVDLTYKLLGLGRRSIPVNLVDEIRKGLKFSVVESLAKAFNMTTNRFAADYLAMSPSTVTRRRQVGLLNELESDKAARFARLITQATELYEGDEEAALRWLETPLLIFDGESPLDYARSEAGCREVEALITRLEYGMFS